MANEIRDPQRTIPRSLFLSTLIVTVLYILLNTVFMLSTPVDAMTGQVEVGLIAAQHIFGTTLGNFMGMLVALLLVSSISSMVFLGPRVSQVMGEDTYILRALSRKNYKGIPTVAIWVQFFISLLLIITNSFEMVTKYTGITLSFFAMLTVAGVFIHRKRFPDAPRPYKTWGYPVVPCIFIILILWSIVYLVREDYVSTFVRKTQPVMWMSLMSLLTLLTGAVLYIWNQKIVNRRKNSMITKKLYVAWATFLCVGMTACSQKSTTESPDVDALIASADSIAEETVPVVAQNRPVANTELTDAARFVAGIPVKDESSKLYETTQKTDWQNHSRKMDQIWNTYQQIAPEVAAFSENELSDINKRCTTLFYPFGGPDFLFSNTFFPEMDTYFLIGLEPAGTPIRVKDPSHGTYKLYQDAVSSILNWSFFRTKDMRVELTNDTIDGTLPIISLLLVRSGREIVDARNCRLTTEGEIVYENEDGTPINRRTHMAEVKYFQPGTDRLQTLYYLSTDLSNAGFPTNEGLKAYLNKLDPTQTATFIKSASYLMHHNHFSGIRDAIHAHSLAVMQDDSGIPLPKYDPDLWNISLYGAFTKPIPLFYEHAQPELREAYENGNPKPLNFRIGYSRESNLLVARKK